MQNSKSEFREEFNKRTYRWVLRLISFLESLPSNATSDVLIKQLLRSGTSIGANLRESRAGSSRKDFTNFLNHALKSANESEFWLAIFRDTKRGNSAEVQWLMEEVSAIAKILASSIITAKGKK